MIECEHGYDCCPKCDKIEVAGLDGVRIQIGDYWYKPRGKRADDIVVTFNEMKAEGLCIRCASSEHNAIDPAKQACCFTSEKLAAASASSSLMMDDGANGTAGDAVRGPDGQPIKRATERPGMKDGRITYAVNDAAGIRASMKKLGLIGDDALPEAPPVKNIHEDWLSAKEFWASFHVDFARQVLAADETHLVPTSQLLEWYTNAFNPALSDKSANYWASVPIKIHAEQRKFIPKNWGAYIELRKYVRWWEERNAQRP